MKINILKENMLRFGTKNLTNSTSRKLNESVQPRMEDMVTLNGNQHAVDQAIRDYFSKTK